MPKSFYRWEGSQSMKNFLRVTVAMLLWTFCILGVGQTPTISAPPATPKRRVADEYFGVRVTEDYRWLENWDDPAVKQWSAAQDARTRAYLEHLTSYAAIHARLVQLKGAGSVSYDNLQHRAGRLFAGQHLPGREQPLLVALRSPDDPSSAKVILDPNKLSARGAIAVSFFVPSFDGKYVAAVLSKDESEDGAAHIFEVATGKELTDVVARVNFATAGGSIAWNADSSGFYYTRYPQGNERPPEDANFYQQVYFHKLGADPKQDSYIIGKDFPRIAEITLRASDDGRWLLASVANGDGGQFAHYLMDPDGHWTQITRFEDGIVSVKFGPSRERDGGESGLYLLSHKDAPRRRILRMSLTQPLDLTQARVIVPQSSGGTAEADRASIEDFVPSFGHLYVIDNVGGPSRLRVFDGKGQPLPAPTLPAIASVHDVTPIGTGDVLFSVETYIDPPGWYRYDAISGKTTRSAMFETAPFNFDDAEVVREFATSKDGTRVPMNIVRLKTTKLEGNNPVLLTAYGGYGNSLEPTFEGDYYTGSGMRLWLDQGGVFVEANLRGGGEYGEQWHQEGSLTQKQNVFDDFIACAQYLVDKKYTSPKHLAIYGASNGGLLMGAVVTQRPDLFHAVVSDSGWYDMLRVELASNGEFNTTEFGTVKDPEQFKALYAYSPYHRVKDGTAYPAIYLSSGENDNREDPMQSRKMAARLQAASSSGRLILLRTVANAGHGWGEAADVQVDEGTDVFSFLFDQMGIVYPQGGKDNTPNP